MPEEGQTSPTKGLLWETRWHSLWKENADGIGVEIE